MQVAAAETATKFAIGPEGRNRRSRVVREKTCKRCGTRYNPAAQQQHTAQQQQEEQLSSVAPRQKVGREKKSSRQKKEEAEEEDQQLCEAAGPCRWHAGTFQRRPELYVEDPDGELERFMDAAGTSGVGAGVLKGRGRKARAIATGTGKQPVMRFRHGEDTEGLKWSCCGATEVNAPGCQSGPHL